MKSFPFLHVFLVFFLAGCMTAAPTALARQEETAVTPRPAPSTAAFDIGSPTLTDLWVDGTNGNDSNNGSSPTAAFRTIIAAWNQIPSNAVETLTQGYRINIQPGTYAASTMPHYWEDRLGTFEKPVWIRGNGMNRSQVVLRGDVNMYNSSYIYFENLTISRNGDAFHCELCDHVLLRNIALNGGTGAHETLKVNQSQYFYIEDSTLANAGDNVIDFVAVQYGHLVNSRISGGGDWCAYVKGGSAYILVESNVIHDCGTGGFTAGQGTGFQFMTPPWIQYEAYDVKFVNNVIYDTEGAGIGVNGGYNILMAYNTMYRVGSRSHVIEAVFGMRSCDGQPGDDPVRENCAAYLTQDGWGTTVVDNGSNHIHIPNKNVFIYNNIVYNPAGYRSQWSHFAIYEPRTNPNDSNNAGPDPAYADDNLQIKGNLIWNGPVSMPLGIEDTLACVESNTACNQNQLSTDNKINTIEPQFLSPQARDFHPSGDWMTSVTPENIPDFTWDIAGMPAGNNSNAVPRDFDDAERASGNVVGAFITEYEVTSAAFPSNSAQDGWILESSETSNKGGTLNKGASTLNLGDDSANWQYRAVLSFSTLTLPVEAVITSVILWVRRQGVTGSGNPVSTFNGFMVDIKSGSFGTSALQKTDFQTAAGKTLGAFSPTLQSGWYALNLTGGKAQVNKAGLTQIRLRFKRDDNNNFTANVLKLYSGNAGASSKPQLIVEYYVP
jgi:hypothetical protein